MRAITIAAGILGFAAIAAASDGVVVTAPARTWEAEYVYDPGAADQSMQHLSVTRQLKYYFADGKIDGSDPKRLAPADEDNIREYLESDVNEAFDQANEEANKAHKKMQDVLPKYLSNLRFKTVDCRQVTRDMIETLVGNRVKDSHQIINGTYSLQYIKAEDQMDVALTARQFDSITISRDPSIGANDKDPRFTCRETAVGDSPAKCGDLRIRFNPLEAQSGAFKGKKAVVFNPDQCSKFPNMTFTSCELLVQVQRCGLRYSEKADGARVISTPGLADFLEHTRNMDLHARQNGWNDTVAPQAEAAEASPAGPKSFYDQFKSPSDPGSRRPAQ